MSASNYVCRLGVMGLGGCGNAVVRQIMTQINPINYRDLRVFAANTDAKVLKRYFGNSDESQQKLWHEAGAFTSHQFGGEAVTQGNGAGADPKIGRLAAETPESIEAMETFIQSVDEVIMVLGLGGGTGTGAGPVAAELCVKHKKSALALVVMPEPEEGLEKYAVPALKEIRSKVTTATIYNSRLMDYLETLPEKERKSLTTRQVREIINDKSLVRILKILREVIQETGEEEFDIADYRMTLLRGKHFYFDIAEANPERASDISAESVVDDLLKAEFIDVGVAHRAEVISLWFHGPWPNQLLRGVRNSIKERVTKGRQERSADLEVHIGSFEETADKEMWVAVMITACDEETVARDQKVEVLEKTWPKGPAPMNSILRKDTRIPRVLIEFRVNGESKSGGVSPDLAERFNNIDLSTPVEEVNKIFDEIEQVLKMRPTLSDWHSQTSHSIHSH